MMKNTRLIMLEGLPGTGKSTNSYFLYRQLERVEKKVKWFHEVARPHPVLFFDEACLSYEVYHSILKAHPESKSVLNRVALFKKSTVGIDLLELEWNYAGNVGTTVLQMLKGYDVCMKLPPHQYAEVALEKWAYFTERALEKKEEIYILDSSIFQYQIFTFLLKNAPYVELERFIQKLFDIVQPLQPNLVYFYRENTDDTICFLENLRGKQALEGIWERDKAEPYYKDKPVGAKGFKHFLMDYGNTAEQLFDVVECEKTSIEISHQDWKANENKLLSFLGAERKPHPHALPPNGIFRNEILNYEMTIDGLSMVDPCGTKRSLSPKSECEFYVENLPVILRFDGEDRITTSGEQICERWTTSGTQFLRG